MCQGSDAIEAAEGEPTSGAAMSSSPRPPAVTVLAGVGNELGGWGIQAEYYLAAARYSVFAGIGYLVADQDDDRRPNGVAGAVGGRVFTKGFRHRGFLEVSYSPLVATYVTLNEELFEQAILYGPGVQAGYQFVSNGGFTFMISLGVGYARWNRYDFSQTPVTGGLGIGYPWRPPDRADDPSP